ncbi:MAG: response regulator [Desulfarculus sp.]|nr:response regulator [Desulfarculus sp.]
MNIASPLVLLVEDDPDTAALYQALLSAEGMEVVRCGNCREALAWWQSTRRRPDLMVLDMRLPDGDGLDLCQEITGQDQAAYHPPIMVLSAHGDPRLPARCRQAGARAFLDKLDNLDQLISTAWRLIKDRGPDQALPV